MKCPKCKQELIIVKINSGEEDLDDNRYESYDSMLCRNLGCEYCGIVRIIPSEEENEENEKEDIEERFRKKKKQKGWIRWRT